MSSIPVVISFPHPKFALQISFLLLCLLIVTDTITNAFVIPTSPISITPATSSCTSLRISTNQVSSRRILNLLQDSNINQFNCKSRWRQQKKITFSTSRNLVINGDFDIPLLLTSITSIDSIPALTGVIAAATVVAVASFSLMTTPTATAMTSPIISDRDSASSQALKNSPRNNVPKTTVLASTTNSDVAMANDDDEGIYDLAIIGGGVVGASAAITASQGAALLPGGVHRKIILLDAPKASGMLYNEQTNEDLSLGGPTGLFSKALRDTSKRINVRTLRGMGLREDSVWNEIINSCVDLASSNAQDIIRQLVMSKVTYLRGFVTFADNDNNNVESSTTSNSLRLEQEDGTIRMIQAEKVLICTGSKPFLPKNVPFDGRRIFDSDSINTLKYLPRSIAITGSGIIAVEFAKIFRNLGADVTLIIRDNIPRNALMKIGLDKDVAATLVADLVRSGIKFVRGAQVQSFQVPPCDDDTMLNKEPIKIVLQSAGGVASELPSGTPTELRCDAYLAAVGRIPNTQDLHLSNVGIQVDDYGGIKVDGQLRTTSPSGTIFAAGDVLGRPFLASTGVAQAKAAVKTMFDATSLVGLNECAPGDLSCSMEGISQAGESFDPASLASNPFAFPTGVWSSPEASYYGLSVAQAEERGVECGEAMALYAECLRGRVFSPNGLLKLVYEKPAGRILGVHICGDDACELIHYGMELVKARRTVLELSQVMFSAVTFHEMYRIAAQAALDEPGARQRRAAAGKALAQRNRLVRDKALQ
jgi:NAD(P) transhydrogenase